jgi:hypothetical protein
MLIVPISVFVHADPSAPASVLPDPLLVPDEDDAPLPPVLVLPLVPVLLLLLVPPVLVPLAPLPLVLLPPVPVLLLPLPVLPLPVPVVPLPLVLVPPVPVPLLLPPVLPVLLSLDPSVLFPAELPPLLAHAEIRAAARPATEAVRNVSCAQDRGACRIRLVEDGERDSLADIAKDLRGSDGAAACPGLYDTPDDSGTEIARFRRHFPRTGRHFRRIGRPFPRPGRRARTPRRGGQGGAKSCTEPARTAALYMWVGAR